MTLLRRRLVRWLSISSLLAGTAAALVLPAAAGCSKKHRSFFGSSMSIDDVQPADGSSNVDPMATVSVRFSSGIRSDTISASTFKVTGSTSGVIAGTYSLSDSDRRVTFTHPAAFARSEVITLSIHREIRAKSGASSPSRNYTFTVKPPDVQPTDNPKITARSPQPNATDVAQDAQIVLEFDQALDPFTVNLNTVGIFGSLSGRILAQISSTAIPAGQRLTLTPQRDFFPFERITVILGNGIRSTASRLFLGETFSFSASGSLLDVTLERGDDIPVTGKVVEIAAGDFNNDGLIDLVARAENSPDLQLFKNSGQGKFTAQTTLHLPQTALTIHLLDADGDGRLDILAGSSDRVSQFKSLGAFAFQGPTDYGTGTAVHHMVSGDLDHETIKNPDLILDTDRGLKVYLGGIAGTPYQTIGNTRLSLTKPVLSDLNRDGFLELIYGDTTGNRVSFHSFVAGQGFAAPQELALPSDARAVTVDDINRDGVPDIVVLVPKPAGGGEEILFLPLSGGASTNNGESILLPTLGPSILELTDIDGDGWVDILLSNQEAGNIRMNRNGDGIFNVNNPGAELVANQPVLSLVSFDFSGDGMRDIIASVGDKLITLLSEIDEPPPVVENQLSLTPAQGAAGARGVPVSVMLSNDSPIEAYTVVVGFNPGLLTAASIDIAGSITESLNPDFKIDQLDNDQGHLSYNVIFEILDPFEGIRIPAGDNRLLFKALFDVKDNASAGETPLIFPEPGTTPPVQTVLSSNGAPVAYTVSGSVFTIQTVVPPPENLLRVLPVEAKQGDQAVAVQVMISNDSPIDAFTILMAYDPEVLTAASVSLNGTATDAAHPDFTNARIFNNQGYLAYDVLFDVQPPFAKNRLLPGPNQLLIKPLFNILSDAALGMHDLTLPAAFGSGNDKLTLVSDGLQAPFKTTKGAINVLQGPPPPDNPNKLRFRSREVQAGTTGNLATILISNEDPIDAYTVAGTYNPAVIDITAMDIHGTVTEPLAPEFVVDKIQDAAGYFIYSAIFDFMPPFTTKKILPGTERALLNFIFDVPSDAPTGSYPIELKNQVGDPPLDNVFVKEGFSVFPDLFSGAIDVVIPPPPTQKLFIRGDVNMSARVDIADYIFLVSYIYKSGVRPLCLDAADIDDNGRIEFVDLVVLLDYIFRGKMSPKAPFPMKGADPTDDQVPCEQGL